MSANTEVKLVNILLVEDNPGDVRLIQEVFKDGSIITHLDVARDGEEAVSYLHKRGVYQTARKPDLILLDLNLPRKNGAEVLADIKSDDHLKRIPVIILTASKAEEDITRAYNNHANCYLAKPIDFNQFINVVHQIKAFWLGIVQLPMS